MPGVEPTNNAAERAIRPAVWWRQASFGTQSDQGSRFVESLLTVSSTCRLQARNVLDYLVRALGSTFAKSGVAKTYTGRPPMQCGPGRPDLSHDRAEEQKSRKYLRRS